MGSIGGDRRRRWRRWVVEEEIGEGGGEKIGGECLGGDWRSEEEMGS